VHVMRGLYGASLTDWQSSALGHTFEYSFRMALFFMLSGLFFAKGVKKYAPFGFFIKRCKTILYPYIIWSLIQTGVEIAMSRYANGEKQLSDIYTCLIVPQAQFWFMFSLFFINIVNILLYKISNKRWLTVSMSVGVLYFLFPVDLSVFSNTFKYLIFFNAGIYMSDILLNGKGVKILSEWKCLVGIIPAFIVVEHFHFAGLHRFPWFSLIAALTGALLILSLSGRFAGKRFARGFVSLGSCSMEIYILHILAAAGTRIVLNNFLNVQNTLTHIIAGTFCGVLIPFAIAVLFRNRKWFQVLFRLP
jgi:fucose 4-O-acetylase-like acetyltransferase